MRTLLLPGLATVLALPAVGTFAAVDPFDAVDPHPLLDGALGVGLVVTMLVCCWLGAGLREGQALSIAVVGWELWALRFQSWASAEIVALASAAGVLVVVGAAFAVGRRHWGVVALGSAALLTHLLGYQPFSQPWCGMVCVETWAPMAEWWGPGEALGISVGLEWLVVLVVVGSLESWRALPCAVAAVAAAAADTIPWWRWSQAEASAVEDRLRTAAVVGLGVWLGWTIIQRMVARGATQDLVRQLTAVESFPGVAFAVPGSPRWVDHDGQPCVPAEGAVELPGPDGRPSVSVPESWRAADSLSPVDMFVLDSARLAVVARTRMDDLRASQQRIVAAADSERRRIERDLHDGVQQQLVGASLHLAARGDPATETAERQIRETAAALRDISHGSLLAVLGSEGLLAALEDLMVGTEAELVWSSIPPLEPSVERAAYDVVAGALRSKTASMTVRFMVGEGRFCVICEPSPDLLRQEVIDRVAATGGSLDDADGLKACWPCES